MKNTFIALLTIVLLAVSPVTFAVECPLCNAAKNGNLSEVKKLLESGADVNYEDNIYRRTALMSAAENGHNEVVNLLLENDANANHENRPFLWTALMLQQ